MNKKRKKDSGSLGLNDHLYYFFSWILELIEFDELFYIVVLYYALIIMFHFIVWCCVL